MRYRAAPPPESASPGNGAGADRLVSIETNMKPVILITDWTGERVRTEVGGE